MADETNSPTRRVPNPQPAGDNVVFVGCKLPNGLLLEVGGKKFEIAGANSSEIIGGYGLTAVPKDLWEAWAAEHSQYEPLKNDLIFVQGKQSDAKAQAKEQAAVKGVEGIDPKKPGPGVEKADSDDGKKK